MFIVRWLMSHPILFAWALAALAIILNWGTKSGVDHAEPKDVAAVHSQQTSEAKDTNDHTSVDTTKTAQQVAVEAHTPESPEQPVVPAAPLKELEKPEQPEKPGMDASLKTETVTANAPEQVEQGADSASSVETVTAKAPQQVEDATETAANNTAEVASTENESVDNTIVEKATAEVTDTTGGSEASLSPSEDGAGSGATTVATDVNATTPDALLKAAREAFWHNQKEESASIYKQLIEMQPEVLEHKGELGNVYWHQNKQKESAALYAEIAIPLIKQGKSAQVENMLGFIGAFFPERATEIHQYLLNNQ